MNINDIAPILVILAVLAAIVGGLGILGLGRDSRGLDIRSHSADRSGRSLLS